MSSEHYFTPQPTSEGGRRELTINLRGHELRLVTEAGVFSRFRVDAGTKLLIKHMEVSPADRALDLGCGYGVVGIVAARLTPQGRVALVDVNARAVALAQENIRANHIENAEAYQGDGFAPVAGMSFDVILLNPPIRAGAAVIHRLIEQAKERLFPGGRFYLVARTQQGAVRLSQKMAEVFGEVSEVAKGGGYRLYCSRI